MTVIVEEIRSTTNLESRIRQQMKEEKHVRHRQQKEVYHRKKLNLLGDVGRVKCQFHKITKLN